jgi:hypothetical protein
MSSHPNIEVGSVYMATTAFWAALLYFFVSPWIAFGWLAFWVIVGLLLFLSIRQVEVKEPRPGDLLDFEEALKCRGRLPRSCDYEGIDSLGRKRVGTRRRAS